MKRMAYKYNFVQDDEMRDMYRLAEYVKYNFYSTSNTTNSEENGRKIIDGRGIAESYVEFELTDKSMYVFKVLTTLPKNRFIIEAGSKKLGIPYVSMGNGVVCPPNQDLVISNPKWVNIVLTVKNNQLFFFDDVMVNDLTGINNVVLGRNSDFIIYDLKKYEFGDKIDELNNAATILSKMFFGELVRRNVEDNHNVGNFKVYPLGSYNESSFNYTKTEEASLNYMNVVNIKGVVGCKNPFPLEPFVPHICFHLNHMNVLNISNNRYTNTECYADKDNIFTGNKMYEYCIFGENNYGEDVDLSYNKEISLLPYRPKLSIKKKITAAGIETDNFIQVEDTEYVLLGHNVYFTTEDNAFVKKRVVKVDGNKIYFDTPLNCKVFNAGFVYSHPPVEYDKFETTTAKDTPKYRRRIYIKDLPEQTLYMRDVQIGDFKSIVNYVDEITSLLITNDITEEVIPEGTSVIVPEYKFVKSVSFKIGEELPNVYIGQTITIEDKEYIVSGFDKSNNTVTFKDNTEDLTGKLATTSEVPEEYYAGSRNITKIKLSDYKLYDKYIKVKKSDLELDIDKYKFVYIKGELINIKGYYRGVDYYYIELENTFLPIVINNSIIKGHSVVPRDKSIDDINADYKEYKKIYESEES